MIPFIFYLLEVSNITD